MSLTMISILLFICLIVVTYLLYKFFPMKQFLKYVPSGIVLLGGCILMLIAIKSGGWEGIGYGSLAFFMILTSLLTFVFSSLLEYFALSKLKK
ncbi:YesK family protein [Bacillus sp. DX4.1]|uniref:YesK family protein n=1 Tax=Bacillus sp. DX4.1 TaxID=3055867 RepID=UPI0025A25409|nr:YesK family protein [Bacillus sp. DX4.1]MDM5188103.1 YesK family protein [Bacillus sp. DX4.1]